MEGECLARTEAELSVPGGKEVTHYSPMKKFWEILPTVKVFFKIFSFIRLLNLPSSMSFFVFAHENSLKNNAIM